MAVDLDTWNETSLVHANPFNYGDMTGMVTTRTRGKGTWTVVHDGGVYDAAWSKVTLNAFDTGPCTEVGGTNDTEGTDGRFEIAVRAADAEVDLASAVYQEGIQSGVEFSNVWGRFIEVRVRLSATTEPEIVAGNPFISPALCDVTVEGRGWTDCNHNNASDQAEISANPELDCNVNGILDVCEIDSSTPGGPFFCHGFCDPDCNGNGIPDACDVDASDPDGDGWISGDCDGNGVPDEAPCEPDCNNNGTPDVCDILAGEPDYDLDGIPDVCNSPIGACCGQQDSCELGPGGLGVTKAYCEAYGAFNGFFLGAGSDCTDDPCHTGACCHSDGTCDVTPSDITCESQSGSMFLGYGSTCEPNCCPQTELGGDTCGETTQQPGVNLLTVPFECKDLLFSPVRPRIPCVDDAVRIAENPDYTCGPTQDEGFSIEYTLSGDGSEATASECGALGDDRVWWETFELEHEAEVTIEFCCTEPAIQAYHTVLFDDCPCGVGIPVEEIGVSSLCAGYLTLTWTLPAGRYYYPILIGEGGVQGRYHLQIKVSTVDIAACCLGDTCAMHSPLVCDRMGGVWLGGEIATPCPPAIPNPCAIGSCCLYDGTCNDSVQSDEEAECLDNGVGNEFLGGISCDIADCPPKLCGFAEDSQCKRPGGDVWSLSDAGACTRVADDFVLSDLGATNIDEICWRGVYHDFGGLPQELRLPRRLMPAPLVDCAASYSDDKFTITFYEDDNGKPGSILYTDLHSFDATSRVPVDGGSTFEYTVSISPDIPLVIDTRYWLAIQNDNDGEGTCYWLWESSGQENNFVSAQDDDHNWDLADVELVADQTMCLGYDPVYLNPYDSDQTGR